VLGCVTFSFTDESFKLTVPDGTPFKNGFHKGCSDPTDLWKKAITGWTDMRKNP
jgi:hypothetical protein